MSFQTRKLTDLEDRGRRSNLIVFGIPEKPDETESDLKRQVISEVFNSKLGVKCTSVARIHRLGRSGSNRPIILFLQDFTKKQAVLKRASKLKGTNIFVQNDYSKQTLAKRKLLWESAKAEKAQGKRAFLVHDKLRVDDDLFF